MDIVGSVNVTSATRLAQLWVQGATSFSVSGDVTVSGALYNSTGGELATVDVLANGFALFDSVAKVRPMLLVLSSLCETRAQPAQQNFRSEATCACSRSTRPRAPTRCPSVSCLKAPT
jgi:hypothetical protein